MGGVAGIQGDWPLARHDHPLYFHSARVTPAFLAISGTTAGYDPAFMAGYPKSIIYPASSTLPELTVGLLGSGRPVLAYKLYVLLAASAVPWLVLLAMVIWRTAPDARTMAILLLLLYLWTDFPIQYARFGMLPYLLGIPLGLTTLAVVTDYLRRGGWARGISASLFCALAVLVHVTVAMVLVPAVLSTYLAVLAASRRSGQAMSGRRHAGFWLIPLVVLASNAFWWWPGVWLTTTKGDSSFAFAHPEGVVARLAKIPTDEPAIQIVLWILGALGLLVLLTRREGTLATALGTWIAAGFFWGYAAGSIRALDFLQPGRHTYAFYSGAAVAAGIGLSAFRQRFRPGPGRLGATLVVIVALLGYLGPGLVRSVAIHLADPLPFLTSLVDLRLSRQIHLARLEPFLSSRPRPRWTWIVDRLRAHVHPGERLLYEEGGFAQPGLVDPFDDARISGLIPYFLPGVELLGGPYLHAALKTNFTQFGEGRLFGKSDWNRQDFVRYARLYRPAAILCWSPHARAFCEANPDLVTIRENDGTVLIGRVNGFTGATITGQAQVQAEPGRLTVSTAPNELDGRIVLRYHFVPHLRAHPATPLEPVLLEDDPVPFLGLPAGLPATTIELHVP